jgi:ABC-2 type transport system permease protein
VLGAARGLARLPVEPARERVDTFEVRAFYNPERRSAVQIVPGLIGVILTMTMTLFTALSIARFRKRLD